MIRLNNDQLYTGITTDLERRFAEHSEGGKKGSKYLRGRGPLEMVFSKKVGSRSEASKMEAKVKKLPRSKKEEIISGIIPLFVYSNYF